MSATRPHASDGGFARGRRTFRRWRRSRPFWGGLLTALGGLFIFGTTQMSLGGLSFQMGPSGFLSWLIPTALVACGLLSWFTPNHRMFYAIIAAVTALYSLIGVNLGGFFIGMLLGVVGAGLIFAWTPVATAATAGAAVADGDAATVDGDQATVEGDQATVDGDEAPAPDATVDDLMSGPMTDVLPQPRNPLTEEPAGAAQHRADPHWTEHYPDERVTPEPPEVPDPPHRPEVPGTGPGTPSGSGPRMYGIALLVVSLAAVGAVALPGAATPAYAKDCPIAKPTREQQPPEKPEPRPAPDKPADEQPAAPDAPAAPAPTATPEPEQTEEPDEGGNIVEEVVEGVVDGFKDLLGIGEEEEPAEPEATPTEEATQPAPSPSASSGANPGADGPGGEGPGDDKPGDDKPGGEKPGGEKPGGEEPKKKKPAVTKVDSIEDLEGCTQEDLQQPGEVVWLTAENGQPTVAQPSRLTGSRVTMFGLSYDGVVSLPTRNGTIDVLLFSMDRSVTNNFELVTPDGGGRTTSLKSSALTVAGDVKFYASRFHGKLLGIPLTFTPESPPPLTLPIMTFGDPDIQLVFVDCDRLEAPDLVVDPR